MKVHTFTAAALSTCLLAAGCGGDAIPDQAEAAGGPGSGDAELTIRYGNIYPQDTTFGVAIEDMAQAISEGSNGRIAVETFHGSTLGSEQEQVEAVRAGSLEMMQTGTAGISLYVPETALFEQWYAYDDLGTLVEAFRSAQDDLDAMYKKHGFKLLGAFFNGPRSIISREPIRSYEDVQDLRLRVPESDLYVDMANALGAQAVALPLGDVYTGLQTGTIDAMEGAPDDVLKGGYGEVAKHFTLDRHVYHPLSIIYNLEAWNALSAKDRRIIQNAVDQASRQQTRLLKDANEQALRDLREQGVEIIEIHDRQRWAEAVQPASEKFADQFGKNGQLILDAMSEAAKG